MIKHFKRLLSLLFLGTFSVAANAQKKPLNIEGVKIGTIKEDVDNEIRVNPNMQYLSYEILQISGVTMAEVLSGKESFVVTDEKGKLINIPDKVLHKVNGSLESNMVNYTVKIPFRLKTDNSPRKIYFKWEGPDKKKLIELTTTR